MYYKGCFNIHKFFYVLCNIYCIIFHKDCIESTAFCKLLIFLQKAQKMNLEKIDSVSATYRHCNLSSHKKHKSCDSLGQPQQYVILLGNTYEEYTYNFYSFSIFIQFNLLHKSKSLRNNEIHCYLFNISTFIEIILMQGVTMLI